MDAITMLTQDHRKVESLFLQGQHAQEAVRRNQIFMEIFQELSLHAIAEEEELYPKLANFKETASKAQEAFEEHARIKSLLAEISNLHPENSEWAQKMEKLSQEVIHHVQEEESEIFSVLREKLSVEELNDLGDKIEANKLLAISSPAVQTPLTQMQENWAKADILPQMGNPTVDTQDI